MLNSTQPVQAPTTNTTWQQVPTGVGAGPMDTFMQPPQQVLPTGSALPGNMLQPPQRQFPGRGQRPRQGRWGQMPPQAQGQPWSPIGQGRPGGNSMPAPAPTPTYHQNPLGPMPQQQGFQQQPIMQPTPPIVPQQMSSDAMSAALRRQY